MKRLFLVLLCIGLRTEILLAQQGKYDIALSYGFYQTPEYKHARSKYFLAADFDYHILERWTLSTGFLSGQFAYFEDWRNNAFDYNEYTNAKGYESHTYLTGSYSLLHHSKLSIQVGTGLSLFTQRLKYPFAAPSSYGGPSMPGGTIFTAETSFSIVEIPFKLETYYLLTHRVGLGVRVGTFLQFNRPVSGTYFGPQLRMRL